jgi:hypothetical protein
VRPSKHIFSIVIHCFTCFCEGGSFLARCLGIEWEMLLLNARKTCWLTDLSRPQGPYIYRLDSYIHSHIRHHIYIRLHIRLHWYEPLSWGISSYTNCISNGPEAHDAGTHAIRKADNSAEWLSDTVKQSCPTDEVGTSLVLYKHSRKVLLQASLQVKVCHSNCLPQVSVVRLLTITKLLSSTACCNSINLSHSNNK